MTRPLTGWGRTRPTRPLALERPTSEHALRSLLRTAPARGVVARGLGRSYGDPAQNEGGVVVDMAGLDAVDSFDADSGRITAGAGLSLAALIRLALPHGWFLSVTPGTRYVTLGGAIACDVHGKNHHVDGGFGRYVDSIELLTPTGEVVPASPANDPDTFWATVGGLGLTGIVLRATVRLTRVSSPWMRVRSRRADCLDSALAELEQADADWRYSVAWIDGLARGRALGRAVLIHGDHADRGEARPTRRIRLSAPRWVPNGLVNRWTTACFNELYYRRAGRDREVLRSLDSFFYPLDAIRDWNRLYGAAGLVQYQFAVPTGSEHAIQYALEQLAAARVPTSLGVLKRFGPEQGLISFPLAGWTLALDMPASFPGLYSLLDRLDDVVAAAGGRIYLAKDARARPEVLAAMYPRLPEWRAIQIRLDPGRVMQSDLARRLSLLQPEGRAVA